MLSSSPPPTTSRIFRQQSSILFYNLLAVPSPQQTCSQHQHLLYEPPFRTPSPPPDFSSSMFHASNTRLNAAGLAPEHSKLLPERQPKDDEANLLQSLQELYTSATPSDACFSIFANEAILTLPSGDVVVGPNSIRSKFVEMLAPYTQRTLKQRLLLTPESLPHRTIVLDHMLSLSSPDSEAVKTIHSLVVIKRKVQDGKISSLTEEEGHRKATAPLAARAAAANSFYSPTDAQLSPVTSKLNLAKRKHHMKAKPTALFANRSGLRQAIIPGSPAQSTGTNADAEF